MAQPELDKQLASRIKETKPGDPPFRERLQTSQRVLRRVTDGIYREPWAALRELISNAYDADATRVVISTDAPRFKRVSIHDNGNGFTADSLASMCHNIGGSLKRTSLGAELNVTAEDDPNLSPSGRRLIGKLGIGLFSISQLAHQFRIITKVKGERSRTVADVVLFRHAEARKPKRSTSDEIETTGEVQITKIAADDIHSHGTDIIIEELLPRTREEFQSKDLWSLILNPPSQDQSEGSVIRPQFHIGYLGTRKSDVEIDPALPWDENDDASTRFRKLTQAMFDWAGGQRRPSLKNAFDNYLRFIWLIALSVPIDYLEKHPFDINGKDGIRVFKLGKQKTGRAEEVQLGADETVREKLKLHAPERGGLTEFTVVLDGLELRRPIRFSGLPQTTNKLTTPLLFVGADEPNMSKFDDRVTGGPLRFEGYLLWSPRVVPVEHNGALIRVGDASGSLFDETFMRYQISEQKRKEQISAEIFVHEGMDAALNIDRESFNHAHPHYQYVASWVHDAFKQFATRHKAIGDEKRKSIRASEQVRSRHQLEEVTKDIVSDWTEDQEEPVKVEFVETKRDPSPNLFQDEVEGKKRSDAIVLPDSVLSPAISGQRITAKQAFDFGTSKAKMAAITQLLYAAGILDKLTTARRNKLLHDIAEIIFFRGTND